jgi:hypothetical protein
VELVGMAWARVVCQSRRTSMIAWYWTPGLRERAERSGAAFVAGQKAVLLSSACSSGGVRITDGVGRKRGPLMGFA